jgi:SGNH domain (fused to AT3 domains)
MFWQTPREPHCDMERSIFDLQRAKYYLVLMSVAAKFRNVRLINTSDAFCDDKFCHMAKNHVLFFRGANHLTIAGSRVLANRVISQLPAYFGQRSRVPR